MAETSKKKQKFLSGVVEGIVCLTYIISYNGIDCTPGFYGRPWTIDQRLDLFTW